MSESLTVGQWLAIGFALLLVLGGVLYFAAYVEWRRDHLNKKNGGSQT